MSTDIAGLPVRHEPPGLMTPLKAVAVIEGLDQQGQRRWWLIATDGIITGDAYGMHGAAAAMYAKALPASGI